MDNRYYYNGNIDNRIILDEAQSRHFGLVRRCKIGDKCVVINGDGYDYHCDVCSISKNAISLNIIDKTINSAVTDKRMTLFIAAIKNDALESAISMAVQMNIYEIIVYYSEYTNIRLDEKKIQKLKTKIIEDCKQCERATIPNISVMSWEKVLTSISNYDRVITAYENANAKASSISALNNVAIMIGSEGGFSTAEISTLSSKCVEIITLGKSILRAPTAAAGMIAVMQYLYGEWE